LAAVGASSHYFDRRPVSPSRPAEVVLALPDLTAHLMTDRGVFSAGAVDSGTFYLLLEDARPAPEARHLLDLGCGYGTIAITLALRSPATVWAVDVNERALALCRRNAEAAGATGVRVCQPDEVPDEVQFDGIWSNPPVRVGKQALHDLLDRWLPRLAPDATATLVVHKHLGADSLVRWLQEEGWAAERLGSRAGYRLLRVAGQ
jgi:16S rRNA (guanine1207-N2)-methyltransferase